ncbi:hypothetical protein KUV89_06520 [Marinobacter hydrocarbonoclasticus]|nr:hypothetical protein [Marinobacter nauticus]
MKIIPVVLGLALIAPSALGANTHFTVYGHRATNPIVEEINQARAVIHYEVVLDVQRQVQDTLAEWGKAYQINQLAQEAEEEEVTVSAAVDAGFIPRHCQP